MLSVSESLRFYPKVRIKCHSHGTYGFYTTSLFIVADSQYEESDILYVETTKFIPDDSKLTSLFIQLQEIVIIRNRNHIILYVYILYIRSHTCLLGHLAKSNDKFDQLLV